MTAEWILIPCLVTLREEFNRIAPGRDKASDGSIGDTAHSHSTSDHNPDETGSVPIRDADNRNEVHAIDVDVDLGVPGLTMEKVVQSLLARCRSGAEKRLRYIIYNRRIWEASNSWRQRTYTGASPHTEHGHFSASYDSVHEASTASWHLEDLIAEEHPLAALTDAQQNELLVHATRSHQMIRNLEKLFAALVAGQDSRPKTKDPETGLTFPEVKIAQNIMLKQLASRAGVSPADLAKALDAIPTAQENAAAVLAAFDGRSDQDVVELLQATLGGRSATIGRLLATS